LGFGIGLTGAVFAYLLSLAGIAILALIADRLAPIFEGEANIGRAFRLIAYAATASWVVGVLRLVPILGMLSLLLSLYSLYLLYTGVSLMMTVPEDRALGYTLALALATVIVLAVEGLLIAAFFGVDMIGMM
jgi:hypothetical protein